MKIRRALIGFALLMLGACGGSGSSTAPTQTAVVTYKVTGTATRASMTYSGAGGSTSQTSGTVLPWQTSWVASPGDFLYVSAQNDGQTGCVTVAIFLRTDTAPFRSTQSCGAFVIATVSGTL